MKRYILFFSLCLVIALSGSFDLAAQNYTWAKKADLPDPNYQAASFTINNKVYVVGGVIDHINTPVNLNRHVWQYDPATDHWTQLNDAPGTAVFGASSFVIGNYGYVVNGWDSTNTGSGPADCWRYDPGSDSWASMAPFPVANRYTCSAFTLGGKGYVTLGFSPYVNETWQYDPAANAWTAKASFPGTPRQSATSFTIGNYEYVGMGLPLSNGWAYFASDFYRYDAAADSWTQLNDFPGPQQVSESAFVMDGAAYVVCNVNESQYNFAQGASRDIWKYNPLGDQWTYWGIFPDTGIVGGNHVTCNGLGYIGQGEHYVYGTYSRVWWSFGQQAGPYACTSAISKFWINNSTYNFQANGSFSTSAQLSWDFGDGQTGTGTSVIHTYGATGTYYVHLTVKDTANGGCQASSADSVTIANLSNCTVAVGNVHIGPQYTLYTNTSGFGPYTYLWSNPADSGFSSTSPDPVVYLPANDSATYCVTIMDTTGCSASACTQITYIPTPDSCQTSLYIYPDGNVPGLYYAEIFYLGGTPASYSWSFGDGFTSTDSFPSHLYGTAGYFDICLSITDINGCTSSFCDSFFYAFKTGGGPIHELDVKQRAVPTGIQAISGAASISVYPNPANTEIVIAAGGQKVDEATIFDMNGQKVSNTVRPVNNKMDVTYIAPGIYFIEVKTNGTITRVKFTKAQ